jgi:hypothetical protein
MRNTYVLADLMKAFKDS